MIYLYTAIACVLSAILYRAGGMSKDKEAMPKWIPVWMRKSVVRDIGCTLVLLALAILGWGFSKDWWLYIVFIAFSWAMLSSYWDEIFGYDNFYAHGFGCGLAGLVLIPTGVPWAVLLIRLIICTLGMGIWSANTDIDYEEEMGRGVFYIL